MSHTLGAAVRRVLCCRVSAFNAYTARAHRAARCMLFTSVTHESLASAMHRTCYKDNCCRGGALELVARRRSTQHVLEDEGAEVGLLDAGAAAQAVVDE